MSPQLRRLAHRQAGCFTKRQARRLGVTAEEMEQQLLTGEWLEVMRDVLICAGTPITDRLKAWTAVLAVGQPVALAGRSAGQAWAVDQAPLSDRPQLVVPNDRDPRDLPGLEIRRVVPASWAVQWHHGLPVTPVAMTIRDIAADSPRAVVRDVVQHALRRRRTSLHELMATLGRGLAGSARLRQVLEEVSPGYQVHWERRLHRALLRRGIRMTPQMKVVAPDGRTAYLDLGIEDLRFGVEIDGFLNHMARFAADRRRARMLALEMGWTVAPYAVEEIQTRLDAVADEVAAHVHLLRESSAA
jgi:very-short-patch-repair endonuclease